jgi:hypothetical protein
MAIVKKQVCILPRHQKAVLIKTNLGKKQIPSQLVPLFQPIPGVQFGGPLWQRNGSLCTMSYNASDYPIFISRNLPVGMILRVIII